MTSTPNNEWARRSVAALLRRVALALLQEAVGMTAAAERLRGKA